MIPASFARAALVASCVLAAPVRAQVVDGTSPVPVLQGTVGAGILAPRRLATTSNGQIVVVDGRRRLHLLTKRGDRMATLLNDAVAATSGAGKLFAVTENAEFVTLDANTGKALSRVALGVGDVPTGVAYDALRDVIWMVFPSGMVQARTRDGVVAASFGSSVTGLAYGLMDVAVAPGGNYLWVARDHEYPGGMIFGLDPTTGAPVKVIGASGSGPAKVLGALIVDGGGRLWVADLFANEVDVVGADDAVVMTVGRSPAGVGMLAQPAGLAFLENGDLLIANLFGDRIDRYGDGSPLPVCAGDTDCDGMSDAWEISNGFDPLSPRDALGDADGDGLTNLQEFALGTDPRKADTDGDGDSDAVEVANGTDPLKAPNRKPLLVASGATQFAPGIVRPSVSVTEIADPSGCTAAWKQVAGSAVTLSNATGFAPTFVARKAETFRFSVVADCAGVASDPVEVVATIVNVAPLAAARRLSVIEAGEHLELSARGSSDGNADRLAFAWAQVGGRPVFGGGGSGAISMELEEAGAYRFRVIVSDPAGAAGVAETDVVAVGNHRVPVAVAASPVTGAVGQAIALDASGSYREGGSAFAWRQVDGPAVSITGADAPLASFVPPAAGSYAFEVTVSRKGLASPPALVRAFVAEAGSPLPVAMATAPAVAVVGTEVTLDGSGSTAGSGGGLEYAWRQTAGPATGVGSADRALATAYLFSPGSYEFELTVREGGAASAPVRVRVEGRADGKPIPVARVTAPGTVEVGRRVSLDARASSATGFRWTQLEGPWVVIDGGSVATFRPKQAGAYVFELVVDDGRVRSAPVRVSVVVTGEETEN